MDVPLPVLSGARLAQSAVVEATRPRVVVLGSGWASMSMIAALPADIRYENHADSSSQKPEKKWLYRSSRSDNCRQCLRHTMATRSSATSLQLVFVTRVAMVSAKPARFVNNCTSVPTSIQTSNHTVKTVHVPAVRTQLYFCQSNCSSRCDFLTALQEAL